MASSSWRGLVRWTALGLVVLGPSCARGVDADSASPSSAAPVAGAAARDPLAGRAAPFDLDAVIRRVRFGYRAEGDRYVADHASYEVAVDGGRVAITPVVSAWRRPSVGAPARRSAPLTLETASIARSGGDTPASRGAETRIGDDGRLAIDRGAAVEVLENDARGIEQSWAFASEPRGAGPLTVRVRATGLAYRGTTEGGLHFAGAEGPGLAYGHGTWIGADGARAAVPAAWDGEAIVLSVPADVVAGTAYPARLDPTVMPEIAIDDPVVGPADGEQLHPAVAFDGTSYLVVWGGASLRATRVSPAGVVLDPQGIVIPGQHWDDPRPVAASNGNGFLVAWEHSGDDFKSEIRGARVTGGGALVDPLGFVIAVDASYDDQKPSVASAGGGYLVAYKELDAVLGRRVSAAGQVLDATPIELSDPGSFADHDEPRVASSGTEYLAVWQEDPSFDVNVHGVFVAPNGSIADPAGFDVSPAGEQQTFPSVAWNGTSWLCVWQNEPQSGTVSIRGARISAAHTVLDPAGIAISAGANDKERPVVASSNGEWYVAWDRVRTQVVGGSTNDYFQVFGTRISAAGVVQAPNGDVLSAEHPERQLPAIAGGPSGYLLAWEQELEQWVFSRVHATRLDASGAVLDPQQLALATGANGELSPSVASDGTNYLVAWSDRRAGAGDTDIWGALVTPAGTSITPTGLPIAVLPGRQSTPKVASNGAGYLVVWQNDETAAALVSGTLVASDGSVADPAGFDVAASGFRPAVASNGTDYLVAWDEYGGNTDEDIRAARVSDAGAVLDPGGVVVSMEPWLDWQPAVASDGADYLVVWEEDALDLSDVEGARVTAAGEVMDPGGFAIASGDEYQFGAAVASDGVGYYVVWEHAGAGATAIRGSAVGASGTVATPDGKVLCTSTDPQRQPSVGSDGTGYAALWKDFRSGTAEIYGTWLTPQGGVLTPAAVEVDPDSETLGDEPPAIAASAAGSWLVVYSELDPDPPFTAPRIHGRVLQGEIEALPNGAACVSASLCGSGFCADGVCCDDACGNGVTTDCQACSVAKGAAVNGTCGAIGLAQVCRPAADACDIAETCDGASKQCPPDTSEPDGKACDDGDACTLVDACAGGVCVGGSPMDCSPGECQIGVCTDGACQTIDADDGMPCSIGACKDGVCSEFYGTGSSSGSGAGAGDSLEAGGGTCALGTGRERGTGAPIGVALAVALGLWQRRRRRRGRA